MAFTFLSNIYNGMYLVNFLYCPDQADDLKMVLQFACGLSTTAGNEIINHVATVGSDSIQGMVKSFDWPSIIYQGKNAEYQHLFQDGQNVMYAIGRKRLDVLLAITKIPSLA